MVAACLASLELVFVRGLTADLGLAPESASTLHVDNSGAIDLSHDYLSNSSTKHIARRYLKIRELVEDKEVNPTFIPTDDNVADIFTKALVLLVVERK